MDILKIFGNAFFALSLLALTACSSPTEAKVDPELYPYLLLFEKEYAIRYNGDMIITKVKDNLFPQRVGVCSSGLLQIRIDNEFWEKADAASKMLLMFHELVHCSRGIAHNSEMLNNGCPVSIMHPFLHVECFRQDTDYYIDQLREALWKR